MIRIVNALFLMVAAALITHYVLHSADPSVRSLTTPVTAISELTARASQYDGKVVKVEGRVIGSVGIMGFGGYRLQQEDSADTILIMSRGGIPPTGALVTVSGIFKQAIAVNNYALAVIMPDL